MHDARQRARRFSILQQPNRQRTVAFAGDDHVDALHFVPHEDTSNNSMNTKAPAFGVALVRDGRLGQAVCKAFRAR
jgi:hypothetical protein